VCAVDGTIMAVADSPENLAVYSKQRGGANGGAATLLGPGYPCGDEAALLVSEMFGNSVRHSRSAAGGTVTVAVSAGAGLVRVEVTDRSGPGAPELCPAGRDTEGGRGFQLVAGLAARWGWRQQGGRTVSWFELRHPSASGMGEV
jgi:anti-sigma regulatory factor (Ser/Thr protein kinase)